MNLRDKMQLLRDGDYKSIVLNGRKALKEDICCMESYVNDKELYVECTEPYFYFKSTDYENGMDDVKLEVY